MATTRAATFSAKIRTLSDFQLRLSTNQQPPSNAEIITTLRYFQQTLIGFLKDFPSDQTQFCRKFSLDPARWNLYPNLNYSGLFYAICNLLDVFPLITVGQLAIGEAILDTIKALMIFLDKDSLEQLPLLVASQLSVFPHELDKQIVHLIADCVLPFANTDETLIKLSIPGCLMLVFQNATDPSLHTWIVEGAMSCSANVYNDVTQVIAKGTSESRVAAANLLFHYWPFANPHILHRRTIQYKVHAWATVPCQSNSCSEKGPSVKRCFDPVVCADIADTSPPLFLCKRCADNVMGEKKTAIETITQPLPGSSATCQRSECQSQSRLAVSICFSPECTRTHSHVPVRLCEDCFRIVHPLPNHGHLIQRGCGTVWGKDIMWDMVEAVVKLLRETAQFEGTEGEGKRPKWLRQLEGGHSMGKEIDRMADERRMLSRFGVWLMAALCSPDSIADKKAIGYIMYNVFQWFSTTALLPNDSMGASLEQLKTDFVCDWINMAIRIHDDVFIQILSPQMEESDTRPYIEQIKEGLGRLLSLMPYDIISHDTWTRVMPLWLQAIHLNCTEENQPELKILLCKIFESDLCPLPFEIAKVFEFISRRLAASDYDEMFNALQWLHQLSRLEISVPMILLLDDFCKSLRLLPSMIIPPLGENDLEEDDVSIHIIMIDIIVLQLRQIDVLNSEHSQLYQHLFACLSLMLSVPLRTTPHECKNPELDGFSDCSACQQAAFLHQMIMQIIETVSPKQEVAIRTSDEDEGIDYTDMLEDISSLSHPSSVLSPQTAPASKGTSPAAAGPVSIADSVVINGGLQFQTAAMEEQPEEFVGLLPAEEVEIGIAEAITLTETDVGRETVNVLTTSNIHGVKGNTPMTNTAPHQPIDDIWDTSVGRFRFSLDDLPTQLKLIRSLLLNLESVEDPDVEYFILDSLKYLCLHCEALSNARREHRGFLIWVQENLMVSRLWQRLRSDYVQVGELATLLLLHCLTFSSGEDTFWKVIHTDFVSRDWKVRFEAVGRAYVIAHMVRAIPVRANKVIQTSLAGLFYHLVTSLHDPNPTVAQRTIIAIRALPSQTLKLMCFCFESQFDSCIMDRPMIIHAIRILLTLMPEEQILSFDFFIQRFETLVLESQLANQSEETIFVQDLMHTDPMSDLYQRKVTKARKAIEGSSTSRSIAKYLKQLNALKHQLFYQTSCSEVDTHHTQQLDSVSVTSPAYSSGGYGRLREFTDEESNMCLLFNRVVDMENPERHTVYLVISLFVTFLSNKNSTPTDEKANAKKQSVLFRHFNTLLGYSNTEKCFTIPPARLRKSAVCNAFLSGLPEILDMNLCIGNQMLPVVLQLLIHLPSPQKLASDQHVANYSLKLLSQHSRHLWLNSLVLILYKYRFDQVPFSDGVTKLIDIVVKTLQGQAHVCGEAEQANEIATWDDLTNDSEDEEERSGLVRPESLTVTTIQEHNENEYGNQQPMILETKAVPRKRSRDVSKRKGRKAGAGKSNHASTVELRCSHCNDAIESFDEETISLCLISVETFLHREPSMAAPILFRILHTVTRLINRPLYPWHSSEMFVPGNCRSVAKQMLRVTLHQLSSSGICLQLFDSYLSKGDPFWSVISLSLADFTELSPVHLIQLLLEDITESWPTRLSTVMRNLASYIIEVPTDAYINHWTNVTQHLDSFFRRYHSQLSTDNAIKVSKYEIESAITVISHVLKVQNFSAFKNAVSLVEAFAKWLAEAMHSSPVQLESLLSVCTACNRALIRERDKQSITRAVVAELIQAIKFKCSMHEENYMTIANMILQDAGEDIDVILMNGDQYNTAAAEAVRPFLFEILDFIADLHVLAKLKKETTSDSIGGDLKGKLAEAIAVEMSRSNARDCRTVIRFIPWLMSPPSVTQSAPGAFADSVSNVRVLSWLLLGALHANHSCLPVPIECSQHMADYIHFVLAGFADQSKQSVVHMSALFHAFHLCQLWTVYCERAAVFRPSSTTAFAHLLDFWARVTPAILQLLSHSKVLADMVNLHFLNTIQALQQVNSALLCQLYSLWAPILTAYHSQIPNQLRMKLDSGENQPCLEAPQISEWLKKVRYKISQVELQTSAASPYYNV
ncbi:unnamed protein product [Auanema sp. JU1783]|nr:unnamed protein product [Auanema sp. JU1783]